MVTEMSEGRNCGNLVRQRVNGDKVLLAADNRNNLYKHESQTGLAFRN